MNINGHELREYHARLQNNLIITTPEVTQYYDWLRRSTVPQFYGSSTTFKQLSFTVSVIDRTDNAAAVDISKLTEQLMRCTIKFDLYNRFYKCILTDKSEPSRIAKGFYDIEYQLKGYCCGLTEAYQSTGSLSFYNHGNLKSPATISITPKKALNQLLVSGLTKKPITIQHLHTGSPVTIDGEAGLVTEPDLDTIITESSGAGKWLYRKYSMAEFFSPGAYSPNYAPQKADIPTNSISMQELISDRRDLMHDIGYDYLGYLKTAVYVSEATSVSWRVSHDDGCSILVNGNTVYSAGVWRRPTVSLPLAAGWNTVEILWIQHLGDGGFWGTQPLLSALVDQLNCYHARDASGDQRVNKFSDTDLWAFPVVQPGKNTVSVDSPDCTVKVEYKPKFM